MPLNCLLQYISVHICNLVSKLLNLSFKSVPIYDIAIPEGNLVLCFDGLAKAYIMFSFCAINQLKVSVKLFEEEHNCLEVKVW